MAWNPFGVMFELSASSGSVKRTSATQFTVKINASWETYYSGAQTNYGMTASSGGKSVTLNPFGTYASSGSYTYNTPITDKTVVAVHLLVLIILLAMELQQ